MLQIPAPSSCIHSLRQTRIHYEDGGVWTHLSLICEAARVSEPKNELERYLWKSYIYMEGWCLCMCSSYVQQAYIFSGDMLNTVKHSPFGSS